MKQLIQKYYPRLALIALSGLLALTVLAAVLFPLLYHPEHPPLTFAVLNSLQDAENGVSRLLRSAGSDEYFAANFFPTLIGAKGDGINDDTAAIQQALDLAEAQGGGTVYLPAGIYRLTAPLQVGESVALRGDYVPESAKRQESSATVLLAENTDAIRQSALLFLEPGAILRGLTIRYSNQNALSPNDYPETVRCTSDNTVQELTLCNSIIGIAADGSQNLQIRTISMTALRQGISLTEGTGSLTLDKINITPVCWLNEKEFDSSQTEPLLQSIQENLTGIKIQGGFGQVHLSEIRIANANRGIVLEQAAGSIGSVQLREAEISDTFLPLQINCLPTGGMTASGCTFAAAGIYSDSCVQLGNELEQPVIFTECIFSGRPETAIRAASHALLTLNYCTFETTRTTWIESDSDTFISVASRFLAGSSQVHLGQNALGLLYSHPDIEESSTLLFSVPASQTVTVSPVTLPVLPEFIRQKTAPVFLAESYGLSRESENNAEALNQAMAAAEAAGGGIVFLPEGTYQFTQAISVPQNVLLAGVSSRQGTYVTRLVFSSVPIDFLVNLQNNAGLWNLIVAGDNLSQSAGVYSESNGITLSGFATEQVHVGLYLSGAENVQVRNCTLRGIAIGLETEHTKNLTVLYSVIEGDQATVFRGASNTLLFNCMLSGTASGMILQNETKLETTLQGTGLYIRASGEGISVLSCTSAVLTDTLLESNGGTGIKCAAEHTGSVSLQNLIFIGSAILPLETAGGKTTLNACLFSAPTEDHFFRAAGRELTISSSIFAFPPPEEYGTAEEGTTVLSANLLGANRQFEGIETEYLSVARSESAQILLSYNIIQYHAVSETIQKNQ